MSEPLQVKVSRAGKEIGTYDSKEAIRLFLYGTLLATDFFWHDGMKDWAPMSQLQASVGRWQESQRALREREGQEAEAKAQQEKAEAERLHKEAEADEQRRKRREQERATWFRCHCCRESFAEAKDGGAIVSGGFVLILVSGVILFITYKSAFDSYRPSSEGTAFGLWLGAVCFFLGLSLLTVGNLRSPCCPICESTNFSKPEKPDEQK